RQTVVADAVAKDVGTVSPAAVVFELLVRLISGLGRQIIRTRTEVVLPCIQTCRIVADRQFERWGRIEDAAAGDCIGNSVAEFGIAHTNAVRVFPGVEIYSNRVYRRVIVVGKRLKGIRDKAGHIPVLIKGKAVKESCCTPELIIEPTDGLRF